MNEMPLVSVIVPVFNQDEYLNTCIKTITEQTYINLEVLLIDDGSNDSSAYICDEWEQKDSRISVIHKENGGLSDARNVGMNIASGDYICFVDADDWLSLDMIKSMVTAFNNRASIDAVFCDYSESLNYGPSKSIEKEANGYVELFSRNQVVKSIIKREKFTNYVWSGMYKRRLTTTVSFPRGKNYEDMYTMIDLIRPCQTIAFINRHLYNYRINEEGITHKWTLSNFLDFCDASVHEATLALQIDPAIKTEISRKVILDMLFSWKEALVADIDDSEFYMVLCKTNSIVNKFYAAAKLPNTTKIQVLMMKHLKFKKDGIVNKIIENAIKVKRSL